MNTTTIEEENLSLLAQMRKSGNKLIHKNGKRFFVDQKGEYVPCPVGYITGPSISPHSPLPLYVSVQGENGWLQKSFKLNQESDAVSWAIKTAQEIKA